jgi:hypothetical protein
MAVALCVTTFNRQDLLAGMLASVFAGTVRPDALYLIDQAQRADLLISALAHVPAGCPIMLVDLGTRRGCEASAINWYLSRVAEDRIIAHEDIVFAPTSLERFLAAPDDFVIDDSLGLMRYRDRCAAEVGGYDLAISPNYFRYVDVDYEDRLALAGIHPAVVACGVSHLCNGTMKGYTDATIGEYHRRHEIARVNYEAKWRREVTFGGNTIGRGAWRQQHTYEFLRLCDRVDWRGQLRAPLQPWPDAVTLQAAAHA